MLDASWKWLPKTAIFLNVQQGYIFYLNEAEATANDKVSSYPLAVTTGLARPPDREDLGHRSRSVTPTASTPAASRRAGSGAAPTLDLSFTLRPTMLSRIVVGLPARLRERGHRVVLRTTRPSTRRTSSRSPGGSRWIFRAATSHRNYQGQFVDPAQMIRVGRTTSSRSARPSTTSSATGCTPVSATRCSSNRRATCRRSRWTSTTSSSRCLSGSA